MINPINFSNIVKITQHSKQGHKVSFGCEDCFVKSEATPLEKARNYAKAKIIEAIKKENKEYGVLISPDGEILDEQLGDEHTCHFNPDKVVEGTIALHGHPLKLPLSTADIAIFLQSDEQETQAISADGTYSKLTKNKDFSIAKEEQFKVYLKLEKELMLKAMDKLGIDYSLTDEKLSQELKKYFESINYPYELKTKEEILQKGKEFGVYDENDLEGSYNKISHMLMCTNPKRYAYGYEHTVIKDNENEINKYLLTEDGIHLRHEFVREIADRYNLEYETNME